jgi:Flp pilus assembly pilin Flp
MGNKTMRKALRGIGRADRQRAQDTIEYGIIIATIAVVVLLGITAFGHQIEPWFGQLAGHFSTVGT